MTDISQNCLQILKLCRPTNAHLAIGENYSKHQAIEVIFDGYGEDEDTGANDLSVEKYVVIVDKNSATDNFKMEPHASSYGLIEPRSSELQIYAIYDLNSNRWHIDDPEIDDALGLDPMKLDTILRTIYTSLHKSSGSQLPPSAPWPFATKPEAAGIPPIQ